MTTSSTPQNSTATAGRPLAAALALTGLDLPRLAPLSTWMPVPKASDRRAWDAMDPATRRASIEAADAAHGTPWPELTLSAYARYWRDGNRTAYEEPLAHLQFRLTQSTLAAAWTGDERYLDDVADGALRLCELSTWCWAAHETFVADRGAVVPDPTNPFIDLGAGEIVAQLAWIDYILGEQLDARAPGLRERIAHEANRRVFIPFEAKDDWHWLGLGEQIHNWNPWIHSNLLVATLLLERDLARQARLTRSICDGLDRFLAALPADGGIDEGYSYWWNGVGRLLEALELLRLSTSGAIDIKGFPPLREAARFPYRMQWSRDWFVNHADGSARPAANVPWHVPHRWGRWADDDAVTDFASSYRYPGRGSGYASEAASVDPSSGLGRALMGLSDAVWRACPPAGPPLPEDVWLPNVQVAVLRSDGERGLGIAIKGGHNDENHNHNDVGSLTLAVDGVPYVVDAGQPTYTSLTFGPDRYSIWVMQSDWHNVPAPYGRSQAAGSGFRARAMSFTGGADARVAVDIAGAYEVEGLTSWQREVVFSRATGRVVVTDKATLIADAEPSMGPASTDGTLPAEPLAATPLMTFRYLLAGEVTCEPGRVVVGGPAHGGRSLELTWDSSEADAECEIRELDDPLLTRVWGSSLTRLTLRGRPDTRSLSLCAMIVP